MSKLNDLKSRRGNLQQLLKTVETEIMAETQRIEFEKKGVSVGDIIEDILGNVYKLSKFDNFLFCGHKKTKNGFHKNDTPIYERFRKLIDE